MTTIVKKRIDGIVNSKKLTQVKNGAGVVAHDLHIEQFKRDDIQKYIVAEVLKSINEMYDSITEY